MKKEYLLFSSVLVIAASVIGGAFILSSKDTYIRNTGSSSLQNDKLLNTISVSGNGVVYAKPDIVSFQITVSELRDTVKEAQEEANKKVNQIKEILSKNQIPEKDIVTANYSISPEYDYTNSGDPRLKGQRASQTLDIKVKGIDEKATKAVTLIDEIATIDKIQIGYINFDIEDKTELFSQARDLAFKKAEQKAKELSQLSKVKLLAPVSISDSTRDISPTGQMNVQYQDLLKEASNTSSNISTGQLSVEVGLEVIFGIE